MVVATRSLKTASNCCPDILVFYAQRLQDEGIDAVIICIDDVLGFVPMPADHNYWQEVYAGVIAMREPLPDFVQKCHPGFDPWLDRSTIGLDLQIKQHITEASSIETVQPFFKRFGMDVIISEG